MKRFLLYSLLTIVCACLALAHIRINPTESAPGAREKYTMRVPNERQVFTVKVDGDFPAGLTIYDFEFKPGWKIDFKKDDKGKIIGATWTGRIAPYEFVEFGMLGINPKQETNLVWKFVQISKRHDGRIHWSGGFEIAFACDQAESSADTVSGD